MAVRQIAITVIVLISLSRIDRRRAKAIARHGAAGLCRVMARWTSDPYELRTEPCIVFAPHQDDETLGCGALIARKRNEGLPVHVVFITDGSASHTGHPRVTPAEVGSLRQNEARAALAVLGVESGSIHFLGVADGTLNSLTPERQEDLVQRLDVLVRQIGPGEIFLPCNPDGSSEHDAAFGFICSAVMRSRLRPDVWQYPVWSWWNPLLLFQRMLFTSGRCRQPTEDYRPLKSRALRHYRSQVEATAPWTEPALPKELVNMFDTDEEVFFRFVLPPPGKMSGAVEVI